jgi:hypothetical protein
MRTAKIVISAMPKNAIRIFANLKILARTTEPRK